LCAPHDERTVRLLLPAQQQERPLDWDEVRPKPKPGAAIGENLETLSVAELEARILELEREIARVKAELEKKRRHEDAASALFKR
jgi:uncharacterized small protein (DUF1192 family)